VESLLAFLAFPLEDLPYVVIALLIAFTVHEFAHAYVANKFGDPTAKNQGRLTLSPLSHLDPIGTILIFIAGFGWAKPVPVNRFYFKRPKLAGVLVSLAGPISNLLVAVIGIILYFLIIKIGVFSLLSPGIQDGIGNMVDQLVWLNVLLFIFNLLPFPPLDGYRIIEDLVPTHIRAKMTQYESYGIILFLFLVITPLDQYTITPLLSEGIPMVIDILLSSISPFFNL
jgi:Zn-dependent protease